MQQAWLGVSYGQGSFSLQSLGKLQTLDDYPGWQGNIGISSPVEVSNVLSNILGY